MGLYLLDYGAGNVQSLANSLTKLGYKFTWIYDPTDFNKATVRTHNFIQQPLIYTFLSRASSFLALARLRPPSVF